MQKKRLISSIALVMSAVAMMLTSAGCSSGPQRVVVVFLLDTVRQDGLGCYGNPLGTTPSIDALAAEGVRFDQAIAPSGWTLPSVGSLLTATWPTIHGGMGKGVQLTPIRPEVATAAEALKDAGFATGAVANAAFVSPMLNLDRGFDMFDHQYTYNWDTRRADASADIAIEWMRDNASKSMFMLLHLFDPHLDYDPPGDYRFRYTEGRTEPAPPLTMTNCLDMRPSKEEPPSQEDIAYMKALHHGELAFVDAQIGRVVDALKELGLYDEAMIVVTADHGEEFWEHGGFEHGHTLYDELVKVPLVMKFPASQPAANAVVGTQVRMIDIMPTVFEVAGVDEPNTFAGKSLRPAIEGLETAGRPTLCESTLYGITKVAWRADRYKYIHDLDPAGDGKHELYDWQADPGETNNLIDAQPALASQMRQQLFGAYNEMKLVTRTMSKQEVVNMSPDEIDKLRSLGYIR